MRKLDEQEKLIAKALVRNPRDSDNKVGESIGVNVRTVSRKRRRLEKDGVLSYYTHVDLSADGTEQFTTRHLYIVKFRAGITYKGLIEDIKNEPNVRNIFSEIIFESHLAEIDGQLALLLVIEGEDERDIVQTFQDKVIPRMLENHGEDSIEDISTIRLLLPVRVLRNYLPFLNLKEGRMAKDWPAEAIYVGK